MKKRRKKPPWNRRRDGGRLRLQFQTGKPQEVPQSHGKKITDSGNAEKKSAPPKEETDFKVVEQPKTSVRSFQPMELLKSLVTLIQGANGCHTLFEWLAGEASETNEDSLSLRVATLGLRLFASLRKRLLR